jgi:acyl-CoA thioesterase-1
MKVGMRLLFSSRIGAKCRALSGALALLTALTVVAFPVSAKEISNIRERVMVFGDSLSAAYGIDAKDGWVTLLEKKLQPQGIAVVNASISGETTRGGLARIKTDLARLSPTIVVVALGANDGLRGLPNADTRKNLEAIITAARAASAKVVLVGIQIPPNYGLEYAAQFRDIYPDLAAKYKLPLVPFLLEGIADNLNLFQADRLHPTAAAQPKILDNVVPVLWQAIAKTSAATRR